MFVQTAKIADHPLAMRTSNNRKERVADDTFTSRNLSRNGSVIFSKLLFSFLLKGWCIIFSISRWCWVVNNFQCKMDAILRWSILRAMRSYASFAATASKSCFRFTIQQNVISVILSNCTHTAKDGNFQFFSFVPGNLETEFKNENRSQSINRTPPKVCLPLFWKCQP